MQEFSRPSRPIVMSQMAANASTATWERELDVYHLQDADGDTWTPKIELSTTPSPHNPKEMLWHAKVSLWLTADAESLCKNNTLDRNNDLRLLDLLKDDRFDIWLKPKALEDQSETKLLKTVGQYLVQLKAHMKSHSLIAVKRKVLGSHIDRKTLFGSS